MKFHRATLAAIAATTVFTLSFADGSGANAQPGENQPQIALPLTEETVPQAENVQFVSEPVVQAITLIFTIVIIVTNLFVELAYARLNVKESA